jgi:hypothetical protein
MVCPHCHQTIAEQEEYLMSRHDGEIRLSDSFKKAAGLIVLFVAVFVLLSVVPGA